MKKIISILFVVLMALSLVSCTDKKSSEATAVNTAAGQTGATKDAVQQTDASGNTVVATGGSASTTKSVAQGQQGQQQQTQAEETEWKPTIYKPTSALENPNYGAGAKNPKAVSSTIKTLLGADKKTVGNTQKSNITNDTYKLKFVDDFTGTSLNLNNWSYYTRNYNQAEEQVNRKENIAIKDGSLVITGKKENKEYTGGAETWETPKKSYFTGGAINSLGKKEYTYGRLEICAKLPYSYGMWPAFWTQGTQKGWPWCGEIDIMEFVGGIDQWKNYRDDEYNSGLHWSDPTTPSNQAWGNNVGVKLTDPDSVWNRTDAHLSTGGSFELPGLSTKGGTLADEWRICGLEWTNKKMYFYCNDKVYLTIDITKTSMREAFHKNQYMILNLAMGGSWAGTPNVDKGTVWPQEFKVDWVKVWQKA